MDWLVASKAIRRDGFDWSFHVLAGLVCFSCCSSTLHFICVLWQNWYPNALVQFSLLFWSRWVCAVNTSNHTESKKSFFLIHHLRPHPADQFGYMPVFCHQAQPLDTSHTSSVFSSLVTLSCYNFISANGVFKGNICKWTHTGCR